MSIDDVNINQLRWFKEKIGLVSKEPIFLFCDFNEGQYIPYGKQNASDEQIRPAVQLANAEKSIDKLPLVNPFSYRLKTTTVFLVKASYLLHSPLHIFRAPSVS